MSRRAQFRPAALRDLEDIDRWLSIEAHSRSTGRRFVARLRARCHELAALPSILGRQRDELGPDLRSTPWRDYVILFRYSEGQFLVVRILHSRRDLPNVLKPDPEG